MSRNLARPVDDDRRRRARLGEATEVVDVAEAVDGLGGVVPRSLLLRFVTRPALDRALASGRVVALGRGRVARADLDQARAAAERLGGRLCLTSAALHRGWAVARTPRLPQVVVPRNRSVPASRRRGIDVHRWDAVGDGLVTGPEQTVLDCATHLSFVEAVCVADSAVRDGDCTSLGLLRAAEASARSGRSRRLAVVQAADGRAANPFESAVRVLAAEVPGLALVPQLYLPGYGRPDLQDPDRALVVECDSFTHHARRAALVHDTERYNDAAVLGQTVLRFAYEHPFARPEYVTRTLERWVEQDDAARTDTVRRCRRCVTAA